MTRAVKIFALAALAVGVAAGIAIYKLQPPRPQAFTATDITGVAWARDFELTDHRGQRRTLADFRGKVVLIFFGYTNCPDACPTTLADMAQVVQRLGPEGERVQGLFITTDPARDTAERLAVYVPTFHSSFLGLRGSDQQIAEVAANFKAYFRSGAPKADPHGNHEKHAPQAYAMDHSTAILAFDPLGRARLYIDAHNAPVEAIVRDVRQLLSE